MILIYITCPNKKEAETISNNLLKKCLIVCANIFPISSSYLWSGKIEKTKEVVLIAKTVDKNFQKIQKEVKKLHSYEAPCILSIKINKVNKEYFNWLKKEIK